MTSTASDSSTGEAQDFLDKVFDRAVRLVEEGRPPNVDELLDGRESLRANVERLIRLASQIAAGPARRMPVIDGYEVLHELGHGGMGTVYLARQESLGGRPVALKVLPVSTALSPRARDRFTFEARAIARLRHPNIVAIHDVLDEDGLCAYAMEWVDGISLSAWIDDQKHGTKLESCPPHDVAGICRLGISMARALAAVHKTGILHRDVKPSNILLRRDGTALLADFGLAREVDSSIHTQEGRFAGTVAYAPPEQLRGDTAHVDARSDIYALGVTLYHALALRLPFEAREPVAMLRQIESGLSTPLRKLNPRVPRDLETIITKAIDPDPARRYQTALELAEDLERLLGFQPIHARRAGIATRSLKLLRRNRAAAIGIIGGTLATLALGSAVVVYIFFVPRWVEDHVREARLALLDPQQANAVYNSIFYGGTSATNPIPPRISNNAIDTALRQYSSALRWAPFNRELRNERDVVANATQKSSDPTSSVNLGEGDLRLRGLRAFLQADIDGALAAWAEFESTRDMSAVPDPLVEAATGILYLVRDEPARAYPRLRAACQAFPNVGFLTGYLADASVQCGDLTQAQRLIELATKQPRGDPYGNLTRVRAKLAAALHRDSEAEEIYRSAHQYPLLVLEYADFLQARGRLLEALACYAASASVMHGDRTQRAYLLAADRWWARLTPGQRLKRIRAAIDEPPFAPGSLVFILRQYLNARNLIDPSAAKTTETLIRWPISLPTKYILSISMTLAESISSPSLQSLSLSELAKRMEVKNMSLWNRVSRYPSILRESQFLAWRWPILGNVIADLRTRWNEASRSLRCQNFAALLTVIIVSSLPNNLNGQTITFSDETFNNADWTAFLYSESVPSATFAAFQSADGGNPGAWRSITHDWTGPGGIGVIHFRVGTTYDPSTQGAIDSIDVSFDARAIDASISGAVGFYAILNQDGNTFWSTGNNAFPQMGWTQLDWQSLHAQDFGGNAGIHPDFSASGTPIQFGFYSGNGTAGGQHVITQSGVDNWSFTINQACTPSNSPDVTQHPQNANPAPGATANLSVVATGTAALSYQWRKNTVNLNNGASGCSSTISGATSATLTITNVSTTDNASYDCVVTNACGNDTSDPATLTVPQGPACAGDMDGNNVVNGADIAPFVAKLLAGGACS